VVPIPEAAVEPRVAHAVVADLAHLEPPRGVEPALDGLREAAGEAFWEVIDIDLQMLAATKPDPPPSQDGA